MHGFFISPFQSGCMDRLKQNSHGELWLLADLMRRTKATGTKRACGCSLRVMAKNQELSQARSALRKRAAFKHNFIVAMPPCR
jgi:hypothetical protein